ncbi:MAG: hypothetical protein ACUVQ1_06185 [Candidatus Kapaibacteriales bacterium]
MFRIFACLFFLFIFPFFSLQIKAINLNDIYDELPNISSCNAGRLKDSEKQRVLAIFNQIRVIHKLKPIQYAPNFDDEEAKSALITVANMILDHFPKASYSCYTQEGYQGSSTSNLYIFAASSSAMAPDSKIGLSGWMIDKNVFDLGHRRNMLNPFLKLTSFGRVDGNAIKYPQYFVTGMSLKVHNLPEYHNLSNWDQDFVAYPFEEYPSDFFDASWYLSFSVVADKTNMWNNGSNQVDFSQASVVITDQSGNTLSISDLKYDYLGYGIPNCLYWKANGINKYVTYNVKVNNVKVFGNIRNYSYWFRIGDPLAPPSNLPAPTLLSPQNNATVDIPVTLQWRSVSGATSYRLQVAKTLNFESPTLDVSDLLDTTYTLSQLESQTQFYWRVLAVKNTITSPWSQVSTFTTKKASPMAPVLLEPANNQTSVPLRPIFRWRKLPSAEYYHLQVALDNEFVYTTTDNDMITDTFYITTTQLQPNKQYYWRLRSRVGTSWSSWSESFTFWTINPSSAWDNEFSTILIDNIVVTQNSSLVIEVPFDSRISYVNMYDIFGKELQFINIVNDGKRIYISIENIPKGIYYLKFGNKDKFTLIKVFVTS